jgi:hypothetical protein
MRNTLSILLAATALGLASPAGATNFTPNGATLTAEGSMALTSRRSVTCAAHLQLATADAYASVTSVSFTGYQCATILATGLPWSMSIDGGGVGGFYSITIHGFALQFVHGATCGPADIKARLNPHGRIIFTDLALPGTTPCSINVNVSTTPQLGIEGQATRARTAYRPHPN